MSDRSIAALLLVASIIAEIYIALEPSAAPLAAYFLTLPAIVTAAGLYHRNEN